MLHDSHVPVAEGSRAAVTVEAGQFLVTYARFPAGGDIPRHTHDRACVPVMLDGSFDLTFPGRPTIECVAGTTAVEPVGDCHCNRMGTKGARVLVVQPAASLAESHAGLRALLDGIRALRRPDLHILGRRMAAELAHPDAFTQMALEGMALEVLSRAARSTHRARGATTPAWLRRAESMLRERFSERLTATEVARNCGVHPAHLSRAFRTWFGLSIGEFVRACRLDWAASQLRDTRAPIADIAVRAGFADQSHFTRRFRERMGATPGEWRTSRCS
jgi:AraC family transcriptional regulator